MAKDPHRVHDGRSMGAKEGYKEALITKGSIHTEVEGFMGNITTDAPFKPYYGTHKKPGSEMLPVKTGGRGTHAAVRGKVMDVLFRKT